MEFPAVLGVFLKRVLRMGLNTGFAAEKGSEKASQKGFLEGGARRCPREESCAAQ